jgi:FKBP-type peptidyl-prolyl cis-trans isomerase
MHVVIMTTNERYNTENFCPATRMSDEAPKRINVTEDWKVYKEILREGGGDQPKSGDKVQVHYVGTLESDGSKFD